MFFIEVTYPNHDEELEIVRRTTGSSTSVLKKILGPTEILQLQQLVRKVPVSDNVLQYAVSLVRATRADSQTAPDFVKEYISWGAGPRASQYLILGAKVRALLKSRFAVSWEDIEALAMPVLRHRLIPNFHAEAQGITTVDIISQLLTSVPKP